MNMKQLIITFTLLVSAPFAFALDLTTAKNQGLVGETSKGYLGLVNNSNPEAAALVKTVNAKRKAKYQQIATQNGTQLPAVENLAGKKLTGRASAGHYIQSASGTWNKK